MEINVLHSVLKANDAVARENRRRLGQYKLLALNITSAPGSGKTTLLERTIPALAEDHGRRSAVIVGDLQTTRDAERLGAAADQIVQINTEGGCHLSATMVSEAIDQLDLQKISFLFIENVGNMVCPAGYDLGEHCRVAMLSVPEGDDKVAKYPTLFQPAHVILLNKTDLAELLGFQISRVRDDLSHVNSAAAFIELCAKTSEGLTLWLDWLDRHYHDLYD